MLTDKEWFKILVAAFFVTWLFTNADKYYYSMWLTMIVYLLYRISIKPEVNVYVDKDCTKIEVLNETENHNTRSN